MIRLSLSQYDPRWAEHFLEHRERIAAALGERVTRIEHIGSTSVPGLCAKPVIDIILDGVQPGDPDAREALERAGYRLVVDEPGHRMYAPENRTAHVHLWSDPDDVERHLLFRDWLRTHPDDLALYEHVKRQLTAREWPTSNHYAEAKTAVVETIMRRIRGESSAERIEYFAALLLERLPRSSRVLEIGAGEGLLAQRLSEAGHCVTALDTNLRSFFPIIETPFEAFEAPPGSFDCVVAQLVLHHAADLSAMLAKIARLLEAGGMVAIDDYGWERSTDPRYREERRELHSSEAMLAALRAQFNEISYAEHSYIRGAQNDPPLGFTFLGSYESDSEVPDQRP